ncbi:hypothetical protein GCM10009038_20060 [Salinicola rhizosphaerae]|uniref:Cytochrome ubiquinol oxidase subunit II n=2 Tax=Salinicola rhizosphaerae TaxID=1443141 RepID=A0ABQ3E3G0_9GAMM|nr:hypothetical protein GCM10009038_20060 [Salinicola rhizosphaerae]
MIIGLTLIVVLPVLVLTPLILARYRYGRNSEYRPHWAFSKIADTAIWGVPFLVVIALAIVAWRGTVSLDPYKPIDSNKAPLRVQVVGFDWKWLFIYPDQGVATVNDLVIPTHRPISLQLTSASVMQGFFVPALGSQVDVMNRMVTRLHLEADQEGEFPGKNMQYNGKGFHLQRFATHAVDDEAFQRFADRTRRSGNALDAHVLDALNEKSTAAQLTQEIEPQNAVSKPAALRFGSVPHDLFQAIADHETPDWSSLTSKVPVSSGPATPDDRGEKQP